MTTRTVNPAPAVHVREAGDQGPLLLCLHGIGSSSESFAAQLDGLSPVARVAAWDAPGYGRSPDPEHPLDLDGFADAAAALIRERGGPAHVVGASWGGVIAVRLATRHPGLVASLVLADSTRGSGTSAEKAAAMRARAGQLAEDGPRVFAGKRAPRLLSPLAPAELVRRATGIMAGAVRLPGYGCAAESMAATDLTRELGRITVPALVLCGEHDVITGVEESQIIAGAMPEGVFVIMSGAGHLAHQEQPAAFNDWVRAHLRIAARVPWSD
ncbi:alpha/beta fold hydrolase [Streptomyces sp. Ru87]|uniref:alpha/beta fold hydrolase n=1 Tax=Streptomyces sp. Ru87 TaxID=2044307 RepID=UPI000BFA9383|nr:alpha/beta fold hydrolase [Streptomyces sp. Ru87]PGH52093.1 alpha/beta hydrolase [Streptomyces sp. Ru87]